MENKKEMLSKAYKEGKTIQSKSSGKWKDFEPHNQLDSPNFDYGGIDNWRIKPEDDPLEKAASSFIKSLPGVNYRSLFDFATQNKEAFKKGAEWQADRMYTQEDMLFFAGYLKGCKERNPGKDVGEIFDEWEKNLKHISHG